jgi:hypothetical protein
MKPRFSWLVAGDQPGDLASTHGKMLKRQPGAPVWLLRAFGWFAWFSSRVLEVFASDRLVRQPP